MKLRGLPELPELNCNKTEQSVEANSEHSNVSSSKQLVFMKPQQSHPQRAQPPEHIPELLNKWRNITRLLECKGEKLHASA
jgi:hypothetical protein